MKKTVECVYCDTMLEIGNLDTCYNCAKKYRELPQRVKLFRILGIPTTLFIKSFLYALVGSSLLPIIVAAFFLKNLNSPHVQVGILVSALIALAVLMPMLWMNFYPYLEKKAYETA